ncbi:imelysin family protein [Arcicella sp. LKC2W]|uniref:imelysin family protein n=1 Tax=Arcicella sp. LKC2W TaxID=2984198 RepID=UPI002B200B74|nr:imelysin family protein [Arcicella sp. LKC2W]MEA5461467.1 imelysin family protein [Arcicella sp. LKC2W]
MKKIIILITVLLGIWACAKTEEPTNTFESFDRKSMLTNLGNSVIIPSFEAFYQKSDAFVLAVNAYTADIKNEQKLVTAQVAWVEMAKAWKQASVFKQGPIEDQFLLSTIDFSANGAYLNVTLLEKTIANATTIDNAYIESKGATVKGIHTLEYLLFDKAKVNATIIATYTGSTGVKRTAYLKALSVNLKNQAKTIVDEWKNKYVTTFISADSRDINSSLGVLSNKIIDLIYTVRDERIGVPKGNRNSGTPQPDLAEAFLSGSSIALAMSELKGIENAFLGKSPAGVDGIGLDDLLDKLEAKSGDELLSKKIKNQFAVVYTKLNAIPTTLPIAVVNNKAEVQAAYDEIKRLQVMMEVDMINNLGVLLTFSDNDGD